MAEDYSDLIAAAKDITDINQTQSEGTEKHSTRPTPRTEDANQYFEPHAKSTPDDFKNAVEVPEPYYGPFGQTAPDSNGFWHMLLRDHPQLAAANMAGVNGLMANNLNPAVAYGTAAVKKLGGDQRSIQDIKNAEEAKGNIVQKQGELDYPKTTMAANMVGSSVPMMTIPGAGGLAGAIGQGALTGMGSSNADYTSTPGQAIKDAATGGILGAAGYGAGKLLGPALSYGYQGAKMLGGKLAQVPQQIAETGEEILGKYAGGLGKGAEEIGSNASAYAKKLMAIVESDPKAAQSSLEIFARNNPAEELQRVVNAINRHAGAADVIGQMDPRAIQLRDVGESLLRDVNADQLNPQLAKGAMKSQLLGYRGPAAEVDAIGSEAFNPESQAASDLTNKGAMPKQSTASTNQSGLGSQPTMAENAQPWMLDAYGKAKMSAQQAKDKLGNLAAGKAAMAKLASIVAGTVGGGLAEGPKGAALGAFAGLKTPEAGRILVGGIDALGNVGQNIVSNAKEGMTPGAIAGSWLNDPLSLRRAAQSPGVVGDIARTVAEDAQERGIDAAKARISAMQSIPSVRRALFQPGEDKEKQDQPR